MYKSTNVFRPNHEIIRSSSKTCKFTRSTRLGVVQVSVTLGVDFDPSELRRRTDKWSSVDVDILVIEYTKFLNKLDCKCNEVHLPLKKVEHISTQN